MQPSAAIAGASVLTTSLPACGLTGPVSTLNLTSHAPDFVYHFARRLASLQRDCERMGNAGLSLQGRVSCLARLLPATACGTK